jgi:oligopeptide/dipeptide ABC transporter ATP-binding protein
MSALLEVDRLHVRFEAMGPIKAQLLRVDYRFLDAVLDVSFAVKAGTTFALVGESGSGKSTLGRAIIGLTPIQGGSVRFEGREPLGLGAAGLAAYRRNVAMMFQDPVASLSPRLTVKSLITEPFLIHRLRGKDLDAEARRLLALVGLPGDFVGRYPHQLSGGQARRVGVARALALSPRLIIADEPTAGLDVSVQGELLNLLADLQASFSLGILMVSHNLNVIGRVTTRVAIMYLGKVVEEGPTRSVFRAPRHPYTHALLAANPVIDPEHKRQKLVLSGEIPSPSRPPAGCRFHTRCPRVQERCRIEEPLLSGGEGGRRYACHFPLESAA